MANQNRTVSSKGKIISSAAAPKDTGAGYDLGKNATNSRGKISKTAENSPSASCMGEGYAKSRKSY